MAAQPTFLSAIGSVGSSASRTGEEQLASRAQVGVFEIASEIVSGEPPEDVTRQEFPMDFSKARTVIVLRPAPETVGSSEAISQIDALMGGVEDETVPTRFAYMAARAAIGFAYSPRRLGVPYIVPKLWATTDDVGGIRLLWTFRSKRLIANFGARAELRTYIYYESRKEHGGDTLDGESLRRRLDWLTQR